MGSWGLGVHRILGFFAVTYTGSGPGMVPKRASRSYQKASLTSSKSKPECGLYTPNT